MPETVDEKIETLAAAVAALQQQQLAIARQAGFLTDDELVAEAEREATLATMGQPVKSRLTEPQRRIAEALLDQRAEARAEADADEAARQRQERDTRVVDTIRRRLREQEEGIVKAIRIADAKQQYAESGKLTEELQKVRATMADAEGDLTGRLARRQATRIMGLGQPQDALDLLALEVAREVDGTAQAAATMPAMQEG